MVVHCRRPIMHSADVIVSRLFVIFFVVAVAIAIASGLDTTAVSGPSDSPREYCMTEELRAECPENSVIRMTKSVYGRMRIGRCVRTDFGYVGCRAGVLNVTDRRCSGRRRCTVRVADPMFERTAVVGCHAELKFYLEAAYECAPAATAMSPLCRVIVAPTTTPLSTTTPRFIASATTQDSFLSGVSSSSSVFPPACGSDSTPWLLRAAPGQQLLITLHDYGATMMSADTHHSSVSGSFCDVYAVLREPPPPLVTSGAGAGDGRSQSALVSSKRYTVCGRKERTTVVYRSSGNEVEVRIIRQRQRQNAGSDNDNDDVRTYFLLEYEAVGCADPSVESGVSWLKRNGDKAVFVCTADDRQWTVTCVNNTWIGGANFNCSHESVLPGTMDRQTVAQWVMSLPFEVSVAVVVGLAFIVGLAIFVVGVVLIQRRRYSSATSSTSGLRHRLSLQQPQSSSDPRRCHLTAGGTSSTASVGLLDPLSGVGSKYLIDDSAAMIEHRSWHPALDARSTTLFQQPYPLKASSSQSADQFYSSAGGGGGTSENEYAYVLGCTDSETTVSGGDHPAGGVASCIVMATATSGGDVTPPPPYTDWRLQQLQRGDDIIDCNDHQRQARHHHHHYPQQQQQHLAYGCGSAAARQLSHRVAPPGEYDSTATTPSFAPLDYARQEH